MPRSARIASPRDRRRAVRALGDEPAAERVRVRRGHLVLPRGEHEHVARRSRAAPRARAARPGSPRASRARARTRRASGRRGRPASIDAARDVADRDDGRAPLVQLGRRDAADVAESLHDEAQSPRRLQPSRCAGALDHHHDARARRLAAEDRAADRDRLAGDDLRHRVALLRRVGVHHPGHRLLVRRDVGRRDVDLGADERREVGREAARDRAPSSDCESSRGLQRTPPFAPP